MQIPVRNARGEVVDQLELDERVFGVQPNRAVLHQVVVAQQANARRGTHDTKTRAEVSGGGKKPYRQKGTGHARQGTIRAPHYRGGGIVFGPHPRSYEQKINKQMRRLAMRSALSDKVANDQLLVLDELKLETPKTKEMLGLLRILEVDRKALIVLSSHDEAVMRASSNIPDVRAVSLSGLNLLDVLNANKLLMTRDVVGVVSEQLTRPVRPRRAGSGEQPRGRAVSAQAAEEAGTAAAEETQ